MLVLEHSTSIKQLVTSQNPNSNPSDRPITSFQSVTPQKIGTQTTKQTSGNQTQVAAACSNCTIIYLSRVKSTKILFDLQLGYLHIVITQFSLFFKRITHMYVHSIWNIPSCPLSQLFFLIRNIFQKPSFESLQDI